MAGKSNGTAVRDEGVTKRKTAISTTTNGDAVASKSSHPPASSTVNGYSSRPGLSRKNSHNVNGTHERISFLSQRLYSLASSIEEKLKELGNNSGMAGSIARKVLEHGAWVEEHLEEELELRRNAIGGLDHMWLHLSSISSFNPVCAAIWTFSEALEHEKIVKTLERQVIAFPKYRQILTNRGRRWHGATFVDDPNWDINKQIRKDSLPGAAGRKELDDYTAEFIAREWDFSKPLWEVVYFDNYQNGEHKGGAAVVKGHHTLTDGQGFVMSQLFVSSFGPELERMINEGRETIHAARRGTAQPSKINKSLKPLDKYQHTLILQLLMFALFWALWLGSVTLEIFNSISQGAVLAFQYLAHTWRQRYLTSDYVGERVKEREFATSKSFSIDDVKRLQKAFSGPTPGGWREALQGGRKVKSFWGHLTLNDVMCTIIADVMVDEIDHQEPVTIPGFWPWFKRTVNRIFPNRLCLLIPISIRPVANWQMQNWSTGCLTFLPSPTATEGLAMGAKAMHRRLHESARELSVLKNGILPRLGFYLIQLSGQAPILFPNPSLWTPVQSLVRAYLAFAVEAQVAIVTNVPGPQGGHITLADAQVEEWSASPPQGGKGTLGIGIISYNGSVCITVSADHVKGAPSEGVARRLTDAFERRWTQYLETADQILKRAETSRKF